MFLTDLLTPSHVVAGAHATSKKRLLELTAQKLTQDWDDKEMEHSLFSALCARERMGCTALGGGVAIPHGCLEALDEAQGTLIQLNEAIDFDAEDGQAVDLIFALALPKQDCDTHLDTLAQLADMFRHEGMAQSLRAASHRDELWALLEQWQQTTNS